MRPPACSPGTGLWPERCQSTQDPSAKPLHVRRRRQAQPPFAEQAQAKGHVVQRLADRQVVFPHDAQLVNTAPAIEVAQKAAVEAQHFGRWTLFRVEVPTRTELVKQAGDIAAALEWAATVPEILGAVVILGDKLGAWGRVELVPLAG